jgi:DNA-binding response OmpR family regulator
MARAARSSARRLGPEPVETASAEDALVIGSLRLERRTRNLLMGGGVTRSLQLTPAEASLLEAFSRVPGRLVCRDDLHAEVSSRPWDGRSTLIDFHLHGLRKKLELLGGPAAHGVEIRAVYGEGYTLIFEPHK